MIVPAYMPCPASRAVRMHRKYFALEIVEMEKGIKKVVNHMTSLTCALLLLAQHLLSSAPAVGVCFCSFDIAFEVL
jgi:hypothetical protein